MNNEIKEYVIKFHNTYEKLAPNYGYETRKDTKELDFNSSNGKLMYATINEIITPLLDYITNLQTIEQQYCAILSENAELENKITNLQKELEIMVRDDERSQETIIRLTKENERLKELNAELKVITKRPTPIDYAMIQKRYDDYKSRCKKASDKIQYIIDYGFDYDGFNNVESLKGLIDMLVDYARESKNILQNGSEEE